jgi:uncharacterized integral membrane protein (TIGR00697 family)
MAPWSGTIGSKLFEVDVPLGVTTLHATLSVAGVWFPITFLLTDVVNEFYGEVGARTMTFVGFWMALLAFVIIFVARKIPAASFSPVPQAAFDKVLGNANRVFVASLCAYIVAQLTDIAIFQWVKRRTQSRYIWLRSTGSTLISQLVDTVVVTYVAFYGLVTTQQLHRAAITSYVVKTLMAVLLTPVIYALHGLLHRRMGLQPAPAHARVELELNP